MIYSNYSIDQIEFTSYNKIAQKLLSLTDDEETKRNMMRNII